MKHLVLTAAFVLAAASPAIAQDHGAHGGGMAAPAAADLPAICLKDAPSGAETTTHGMEGPTPAHTDLMAGMDKMNADMMAGGTAADIDVAFACAMIPHHRGAVDMARAELEHGDDDWAKALAEQIIAAQEKEIADMLAWLERQPQ